jgi:carboxypeptidase T
MKLRRSPIARLETYFLGTKLVASQTWRRMLRPSVRRLVLTGLCAATASMAVNAYLHAPPPPPSTPPVRMAIRVDCTDWLACPIVDTVALDVWSEQRAPGLPLDVVVTRDALAKLDAAGLPWQILVPDVDAQAEAEAARLRSPAALRPSQDWFGEYRDLEDITTHLHELVALAPERVSLQAIGGSIEGRPLWALKIGHGGTPMLINGTQHAREWISTMVTTCVADRLIRDYDRDPKIRAFVDSTELWVVPVVNPDGYQYSWASRRFWRKNRRGDHGVDLNRNFDVAWGGPGASRDRRSETYRGEYAFSEPETAALRSLVRREQIALHVDFHAYGQLVLYPWGHTGTPTEDDARYAAVGDRLASALFSSHETRYTLMRSVELYPASGTMSDWVYGDTGALSYTIELRPKGGIGFVLPPDQIKPTCDEGLAAVLELRQASTATDSPSSPN